jgi:hypothetical protein
MSVISKWCTREGQLRFMYWHSFVHMLWMRSWQDGFFWLGGLWTQGTVMRCGLIKAPSGLFCSTLLGYNTRCSFQHCTLCLVMCVPCHESPAPSPSGLDLCIYYHCGLIKSRDSSVGIALGYGLDDRRGCRVRFPAGAGNFSLHHRVQNGSGAHPASYSTGTGGSYLK